MNKIMSIRIADFFLSFIATVILLPFLLIVAIMIKAESKGPLFYIQSRVGKGGKNFILLKFRTMVPGSDKDGLLTIGNNDSRITRVGKFLRKLKIDELPQLINVIYGDMSLVGPRPEVKRYVDLYTEEQKKVLEVKPGITDYASIKFANENEILARSENSEKFYIEMIMPVKIELNMKYINERSLFLYFKILFITVLHIFHIADEKL
jgi:lipopolysaccharide/colanic/teichoic acid biosynthesis glycosyltransferase